MECFRIDESGYTGFDLLNLAQRFQGAAAIAISNEEAAILIKEHFPKLQATELKYRTLARRHSNHPRLLGLIKDLLSDYKCVTYICDKRYLLLLMFLDYAVEPYYYERGINFYKDGQNYAMASLLYYCGSTLLGENEFSAMLMSFQNAMKEKTPYAINELIMAVRRTNWSEFPEALGPLACHSAPECINAIATPGVSTDIAFVVLQSLINRIENMVDGPYCIEHDQSKNLLTYNSLLQQYINHNNEVEFHQSEIAKLKFPLKLCSVIQVDSKCNPAVQLADVMIGAIIEVTNVLTGQRSDGLSPNDLISLYSECAGEQLIHLLPSIDFGENKKFRSGTQASEVIDYFSRNF